MDPLSEEGDASGWSFRFDQLPSDIREIIFDFVGMQSLKQLRLSGSHTILLLVDQFLTGKKSCKKTKLEILESEKAKQLSSEPTKFSHSKLIVDILDRDEMKKFYHSDLNAYLFRHAGNVKKIECSWFFGFSQANEHSFFSAFENLESFKVDRAFDFINVDAQPKLTPSGILNLRSIAIPWFEGIESLGIFNNATFMPEKIKVSDITDRKICSFFSTINCHLKMRQNSPKKLKVLQIAERGLETAIMIPAGLLMQFVCQVTTCSTLIKGMSECLLKQIEPVVDRKLFAEFLKCQKTIYGFHPLMRTISLDQLQTIIIKNSRMTIRDERWQIELPGNQFRNLQDLEIRIVLEFEVLSGDRNPELCAVQNLLTCLLDSNTTNLQNLSIKITMPYWYPLHLPLEHYVINFKQLQILDLNADLSAIQIKLIFKGLRCSSISCISLSRCHVTDEAFRNDSDSQSYFLELKNLDSFSLCSYNPVSQQFFTNNTLIEVFARSRLKKLCLEGIFPAVTADGVRFLSYGENLSKNLLLFELKLTDKSSSMTEALNRLRIICANNFRKILEGEICYDNQ